MCIPDNLGLYTLTLVGCALAQNIETIIIMRLLGGTLVRRRLWWAESLQIYGNLTEEDKQCNVFGHHLFGPTLGASLSFRSNIRSIFAGYLSRTGPEGW